MSDRPKVASFVQETEAVDAKLLAAAMGGSDKPPEEPLLSSAEEGFGYFTSAAVGRSLKQYEFVRKLGWAGSSTVWLALDKSVESRTFVAMKVLTASKTAMVVGGYSPEYEVYRKVESTNPNNPGFNHCMTIRHCFTANSSGGGHIVFVTDALSSSLASLREQHHISVSTAKCIIKQVLLALDYLHRECGYIHTDLKSENILVEIPQPAASRIEQYIRSNPPLVYGPALNLKSSPLPVVFSCSQPLPYGELGGTLEDISVRLVDYGEATPVAEPFRDRPCQPSGLRAPEVTLRYPWFSSIDIWTVGCLLFELLTAEQLFDRGIENHSDELHLQRIEECLGSFPLDFLQACEQRNKFFDEKGMLLRTNGRLQRTSLEVILRGLEVVDEKDIPGVAEFMRRCMTLDPKLRPSAQELLKDTWLA